MKELWIIDESTLTSNTEHLKKQMNDPNSIVVIGYRECSDSVQATLSSLFPAAATNLI